MEIDLSLSSDLRQPASKQLAAHCNGLPEVSQQSSSLRQHQNWQNRSGLRMLVSVRLFVILGEVPPICLDLINSGNSRRNRAELELENHHGGAGEDHHIGPPSSFKGQLILEYESPVRCRRVLSPDVGESGPQRNALAPPCCALGFGRRSTQESSVMGL